MMRAHSGLSRLLHCGVSVAKKQILDQLQGITFSQPPNLIDIRLTHKCNLRCQQCSMWKHEIKEELSTHQWRDIILDIKKSVGPCFLRFYGGEPFFRKDFLELVEFSAHHNIGIVITTNASLINAKAAGVLIRNKVSMLQISLDGLNPETHDTMRGVKGTYDKVMSAIDLLVRKVPLQINTTIMKSNLDEILPLADFAKQRRIAISFQGVIDMTGVGRNHQFKSENELFPDDKLKVDRIIDNLCALKRSNKFIIDPYGQLERMKDYFNHPVQERLRTCKALGNHLWVMEQGDVYPCTFIPDSIGNLSKRSLNDIWRDPLTRQKLQKMSTCDKMFCRVMRGCSKESFSELLDKVFRTLIP